MRIRPVHGSSLRAKLMTACVLASATLGSALVAGAAQGATLTASGQGTISAPPDMAIWSTGTLSQAKTADAALAANSKAVSDVIAAIKAAGIESKDIATFNFSIQPQFFYPKDGSQDGPRLTGYLAQNNVRVTVRDLAKLGALLDQVVVAGANQASGLTFTLAGRDKLELDARVAAVKDAMEQAKVVAAAAGLRVARINSIETQVEGGGPIMPVARMMKAEAARMPVPVEGGELEVRARSTVVFEAEPQ